MATRDVNRCKPVASLDIIRLIFGYVRRRRIGIRCARPKDDVHGIGIWVDHRRTDNTYVPARLPTRNRRSGRGRGQRPRLRLRLWLRSPFGIPFRVWERRWFSQTNSQFATIRKVLPDWSTVV